MAAIQGKSASVGKILRCWFFAEFLKLLEPPAHDGNPDPITVESSVRRLQQLASRRLPFLALRDEAWWLESALFFDVRRERPRFSLCESRKITIALKGECMPYGKRMRDCKALLIFSSLLFCFNEPDRLCAQSSTAGAIGQAEIPHNSAKISHRNTEVNGVQYHYVLSGSGPTTVVLLHGWPVTWFHWRAIIPKLAERYTVVAPDLRGLGLTSKAKAGYDERTVAADIRELLRQLGQEHAYVVGS